MIEQAPEQAPVTGVNVFKNIVTLLRTALHPGAHAQYVSDAIAFLEQVIAKETAIAATQTEVKPDIHLVPTEA